MKYEICIEHSLGDTIIEADSLADATIGAEEWIQGGDWEGLSSYVKATITPLDLDTDEEEGNIQVLVGEDPEPPECIEDEDHDWQSPYEILGGCQENPGVWGMEGTQLKITQVCSRCGVYQDYVSESTPGNYPETPAQTTYREADEYSLAWVEEQN